jgi:hypothetical protein
VPVSVIDIAALPAKRSADEFPISQLKNQYHQALKALLMPVMLAQFKIDHLCQLNFDQGSKAGCLAPGCG